jgi:hypothetical protein
LTIRRPVTIARRSPPVRATARTTLAIAFATAALWRSALAGPPFLTDDPEPVDYHHSEFYVFATDDQTAGGRSVALPAFEYNVGFWPQMQFHLVVPYAESIPRGGAIAAGIGDVEVGIKVRLLEETADRPQVGIFPMAELPTGSARAGLGNGQTWWRLPIWAQKTLGPWETYGGGGYVVNHAPGQRGYAFAGWLVQRDVGPKWTLGAEVFDQGADLVGGRGRTILNLGGYYHVTPTFDVLFSGGRSVAGAMHTVAYLGLYWTWGGESRDAAPASTAAPPRWSLARR